MYRWIWMFGLAGTLKLVSCIHFQAMPLLNIHDYITLHNQLSIMQ